MGSCDVYLIYFGMTTDFDLETTLLRFHGCTFLTYMEDAVSQQTIPCLLVLTIYHRFFCAVPWALGVGFVCFRCISWGWTLYSSLYLGQLWISVMFLICCKGNFFDEGVWATCVCGYIDTYLECNLELYWFKKMAAKDSSLGSMTSSATSSWLGFADQEQFPSCWEGLKSN